jgi:hypothetical protein
MVFANVYPYCRFPEELNGGRCFGDSLVDVLRGYGYDVETSRNLAARLKSFGSLRVDECDCRVNAPWAQSFIDSIQR